MCEPGLVSIRRGTPARSGGRRSRINMCRCASVRAFGVAPSPQSCHGGGGQRSHAVMFATTTRVPDSLQSSSACLSRLALGCCHGLTMDFHASVLKVWVCRLHVALDKRGGALARPLPSVLDRRLLSKCACWLGVGPHRLHFESRLPPAGCVLWWSSCDGALEARIASAHLHKACALVRDHGLRRALSAAPKLACA